MGPETSMEVQAKLGSDVALAFDECTPFHVERDYTARSTERTHRWLDRCIDWQRANAPDGQLLYGIVQGGVYEDLRIASAERVAGSDVDGVAVGGSLGQEKEQMYEVVVGTLRPVRDEQPRHLRDAPPAQPPRHVARAGPGRGLAARPDERRLKQQPRADPGGLHLPGLPRTHARLPVLPRASGRADSKAPDHAAQPHVHKDP